MFRHRASMREVLEGKSQGVPRNQLRKIHDLSRINQNPVD